jgi:hypothetical protein
MQQSSRTLSSLSHMHLVLRAGAAILLLFVGADHYYEYAVDHYSVLPTIGTLFLLNFISATAVALLLLSPLSHIFGRFSKRVLEAAALSGFGIALTSLAALLVSEQTPLFGFMEANYRPGILVAIASEAAAAAALAALLTVTVRSGRPPRNARAVEPRRPSAGTA